MTDSDFICLLLWYSVIITCLAGYLYEENKDLKPYKSRWTNYAKNAAQSQIDFVAQLNQRKPKIKDVN